MKTKNCVQNFSIAAGLLIGVLAAPAQSGNYMYSGSEQSITLTSGFYNITAYGAQGAVAVWVLAAWEPK